MYLGVWVCWTDSKWCERLLLGRSGYRSVLILSIRWYQNWVVIVVMALCCRNIWGIRTQMTYHTTQSVTGSEYDELLKHPTCKEWWRWKTHGAFNGSRNTVEESWPATTRKEFCVRHIKRRLTSCTVINSLAIEFVIFASSRIPVMPQC